MENNNEDVNLGFDFLDDFSLEGLEIAEVEQDQIEVEEIDLDSNVQTDDDKPIDPKGENDDDDSDGSEDADEDKDKPAEKVVKADDDVDSEFVLKMNDLVNTLKENSLIELPEGQEIDEDTFLQGLQKATEKKAANQIFDIVTKTQGTKGWKLFEDLFINGASQDYLKDHFDQEEIEKLDLQDEEVQETLYRNYLKETSQIDDEEIRDQIDFLKSKGKLASKAEFAKNELIKSLESKKEAKALSAAQEQAKRKEDEKLYVESLKNTLTQVSTTKEIEGVPLTENDTQTLVTYVTSKKYELTNGMKISEFEKDLIDLRKDPKTALKLAKMVKEKLNVEIIADRKVSKKASFLFKEIESNVKKEAPDSAKAQNINSLLKLLD